MMEANMWNNQEWINDTNPESLKKNYENKLRKAGFKIEGFMEKYFDPFGYTAIWLLAESHLAIHTFPEENKTYVELSSCNHDYFLKFNGIQ